MADPREQGQIGDLNPNRGKGKISSPGAIGSSWQVLSTTEMTGPKLVQFESRAVTLVAPTPQQNGGDGSDSQAALAQG